MRYFLVLMCFILGCIPSLDSVILRPSLEIKYTPETFGYPYEEIVLEVGQDRSIVVWHVPVENSKAVFVVFPGSDANKGRYTEALPLVVPSGYEVVLMDYEGFGNSPGERSLSRCMDDGFAVIEYAKSLGKPIFLYGVSLGTPVVARVAAENDLAGCIFEGTLVLKQEAKLWLEDNGFIPSLSVIGNLYIVPQTPLDYNILKYIKMVDEPKFFMHSSEDEVTPYEGGIKVFNEAPSPKDFWTMTGGHGRMVLLDTDMYREKLVGWMDQIIDARH